MSTHSFATLRLGKTSVDDINIIDGLPTGIQDQPFRINVTCTQVPIEADVDTYVFIWLGSDNSKGVPTSWKQGFRAFGRVSSINRGPSYNDESTLSVDILYVFCSSVGRLDILKLAPKMYYWCSSLPIIGIDDHSNQTVRLIESNDDRGSINAFFCAIGSVISSFKDDLIKIDPEFSKYFVLKPGIYDNVGEQRKYSKDEIIDIMVSIYTDPGIAVSAAGGIFVFQYGDHIVDVYKPTELIEAAHSKDDRIKTRYAAELNAAYLMYKYFRTHPVKMPHVRSAIPPSFTSEKNGYKKYLRALRTKPFLLLAGISGTGKSRIVRELAFKSCPKELRDKEGTTPGNYLMVEVKPNWHDSTELLGYYSNIAHGYQYTMFIEFAVKATKHPDVPFFVCLDEMNLAPVEQYFAEFLSVLETRKKVGSAINSGTLVEAKYMKDYAGWDKNEPLTLPENLFIIGTVNMDDTTHKFSRKVIDRAMTIEMNGGNLTSMFGRSKDLSYLPDNELWKIESFKPLYVTADEVLISHPEHENEIKNTLATRLESINNILDGTPYKVSYRVLNELSIYLAVLLDDDNDIDTAIKLAVDQIALMKILPRIEGDEETFNINGDPENRLEKMIAELGEESDSGKKLDEMNRRLSAGGFTRFWP